MEQIVIETPITVFGKQVHDFPSGISKVFDELVQLLPGGFSRSFYGISTMEPTGIKYYATAIETFPGEGAPHGFDTFRIDAGLYNAISLAGWQNKTGEIHGYFKRLHQASGTDCASPAIEWYKDDDRMVCMVKQLQQAV